LGCFIDAKFFIKKFGGFKYYYYLCHRIKKIRNMALLIYLIIVFILTWGIRREHRNLYESAVKRYLTATDEDYRNYLRECIKDQKVSYNWINLTFWMFAISLVIEIIIKIF